MNDQSNWIEELEDKELRSLAGKQDVLDDVPALLDEKIFAIIDKCSVKRTRAFPPVLKAAIALAALFLVVLVPVLIIPNLTANRLIPGSVIASGKILVDAKEQPLESTNLKAGAMISTGAQSELVVQLGEKALVRLTERGSVELSSLNREAVKLTLVYGELYIDIKERQHLEVNTIDAVCTVAGTQFTVQYRENRTKVIVWQGTVRFTEKQGVKKGSTALIAAGESIVSGRVMQPLDKTEADRIQAAFENLAHIPLIEEHSQSVPLSINAAYDGVALKINGASAGVFDQAVRVNLAPGSYRIELEKAGFAPYSRSVLLTQGKGQTLEAGLEALNTQTPAPSASPQATNRSEGEQPVPQVSAWWVPETVYRYRNSSNPWENQILGFAIAPGAAVAVTRTELIGLDAKGNAAWNRKYGDAADLYFDTLPVPANNKFYIASNYRILELEPVTGAEKRLPAPGLPSAGNSMVPYRDKLLLPYPEGIYLFDPAHLSLDYTPLIVLEGASRPLVAGTGIYAASSPAGIIACYTAEGKETARYAIASRSAIPVCAKQNTIITGDAAGNLYKLSADLVLMQSLVLPGSVVHIIDGKADLFYVETASGPGQGELYFIDFMNWKTVNRIPLEALPAGKTALIGAALYTGTPSGSILIYNSLSGALENTIPVSTSGISCPVYSFRGMLLTGTTGGDIILLRNLPVQE